MAGCAEARSLSERLSAELEGGRERHESKTTENKDSEGFLANDYITHNPRVGGSFYTL